ncbi:choice-of-anchor D domain-containing protein [Duganella vulcania]|uniref:Choice-of-anchor D domain-containing protein n=1 Tax=Duganella vulcania TaxID=2692166 RepID=A0A845GZ18_9BURK|nr:choice-of-anchor D domain-containing protein [Duganella vulcania]MYM97729.1 choice-of-anchor D domain-containing protein [Duganella vulcania]
MTGLLAKVFRLRWTAVLLVGVMGQGANAADALNGKSLYLNGPVSGGATCASCHTASPANNVNGILAAANQPSVIQNAIATNKGGMGSLFNGKFSAAELADLAAFIGNPNVVAAPAASLAPASLTFSGTSIGQTAGPLSATLSNTGNAALNIGTISLSGAAAGDFSVAGGSCANGGAVAAGASCTVQASFKPTAAGARAASLTITHNATGGSSVVALSGTGNATPQATIALSAASVNFGTLLTGSPSAVSMITVSNSGQAALSFSSIALGGANAGIFTLGGTCAVATPVPAAGSCTVTLQASPVAAGAFSASLALASNASNGNATVGLSGTAATPAPALTATPSAIAFGTQTIGAAAVAQTVKLANTGNVVITFNKIGLGAGGAASISLGASDCGATLAVGGSCSVPVRFAPAAEGAASATLAVTSNAAALQVGITGAGTKQATATPVLSEAGPIVFADTQVGSSATVHTTTLSNSGNASLAIATLTLGGNQPGDFVLGGTCVAGAAVAPGSSCTLTTAFKPVAAGARSADLLLVTDGGAQFHLALSGNGVAVVITAPSLTIAPQSFDYGAVVIGSAAPTRRFTLTNSGAAAVTLASATYTGPFAAVADSTGCAAFPVTLAPGASCDLVVSYTPANAGASTGSVALQSSVAGSSWTIALSGQGTAAASNAAPVNKGGGGCSASDDVNDPMMVFLIIAAAIAIGWRRRQTKRIGG